ncbi:MAG: SGNH/GDSL hydrolase family protein [Microscillaceae bacterium]|nr:SGNH/GDSL hydrolase family protein [Microscillaceae bacterium]MDW8461772.1 SGNH/GDSL hydrolase family protein [Cytophagales bacterium]
MRLGSLIIWLLGGSLVFLMCHSENAQEVEKPLSNKQFTKKSQRMDKELKQNSAKEVLISQQITTKDTIYAQLPTVALPDLRTNIEILQNNLQSKQPIKIVCYGNSITRGYKVGTYGVVAQPYPQVLQNLLQKEFANPHVQVVNEGHNGWRTDQALQNVQKLVIEKQPQWVILDFGINDAYAGFSHTQIDHYLTKIIEILQKNQIKVILLSPTPILTIQHKIILSYIPTIYNVAKKTNNSFCNLHQKLVERLYLQQLNPKHWLPDEVHFADEYYTWIAEVICHFVKKN